MTKSVKALINPAMLEWARDQAGYSPAEAAHKLGIDDARLQGFERRRRDANVCQAARLGRPLQTAGKSILSQETTKGMAAYTRF
jgi:hypothetical protein